MESEICCSTIMHVHHNERDSIPPTHPELYFDCCESDVNKLHLNKLKLKSHIKSVLMHNDELALTIYKINEAKRLLEQQECKMKHASRTNQLSVLTNIGAIMLGIFFSTLCCC
jgi:hypothetical protein